MKKVTTGDPADTRRTLSTWTANLHALGNLDEMD